MDEDGIDRVFCAAAVTQAQASAMLVRQARAVLSNRRKVLRFIPYDFKVPNVQAQGRGAGLPAGRPSGAEC